MGLTLEDTWKWPLQGGFLQALTKPSKQWGISVIPAPGKDLVLGSCSHIPQKGPAAAPDQPMATGISLSFSCGCDYFATKLPV